MCKNELYEYEVLAEAAEEAGTDMAEYTWSEKCDTKDYNPNYVADEYAEEVEEVRTYLHNYLDTTVAPSCP